MCAGVGVVCVVMWIVYMRWCRLYMCGGVDCVCAAV